MRKRISMVLAIFILVLFAEVRAHADLKTLIELGKNQSEIAKSLKEETKNYEKVKKAIDSGRLEEGMPAEKIRKKYGEPIFDNIYDDKKNAYKWLYMPSTSTHFEGEKIYLFVDEGGNLVGWQLLGETEEE